MKNDRQTIQPVNMNTNECGSVGTPPRVESRLSNNKDKIVLGVDPEIL